MPVLSYWDAPLAITHHSCQHLTFPQIYLVFILCVTNKVKKRGFDREEIDLFVPPPITVKNRLQDLRQKKVGHPYIMLLLFAFSFFSFLSFFSLTLYPHTHIHNDPHRKANQHVHISFERKQETNSLCAGHYIIHYTIILYIFKIVTWLKFLWQNHQIAE